jgi:acetyl-CoA carboxylase carboxyl transferase subunit beta
MARDPARPSGGDLLAEWTVLRLRRAEDPTIVTAMAELGRRLVVAIGQQRHAGDGRTRPSGFRRAREAIALAVRLGIPIVTLIDTPGAHPGAEAEGQGLAREIALTFESLLEAPVPTVGCVVGEGGSGGALALAACDRLLILENAIFSVIAPEGAATILRRDDLPRIAEDLRLTAADLYRHGLADLVVAEPSGGAQADPKAAAETLTVAVAHALTGLEPDLRTRMRRWRTWRGP